MKYLTYWKEILGMALAIVLLWMLAGKSIPTSEAHKATTEITEINLQLDTVQVDVADIKQWIAARDSSFKAKRQEPLTDSGAGVIP